MNKVIEIFSAKKGQSGFPRPIVPKLEIKKGFGILDDKFAGKNEKQAVMIVGLKSYELAKENGFDLEYGSLGENILFDFNPHDLNVGDIITIGDVKLKIELNCTICNHLSVFGKALPKLLKDCRGIYCSIQSSGNVKKDMLVNI